MVVYKKHISKNNKLFLTSLLSLVLAFSLSSCSSHEDGPPAYPISLKHVKEPVPKAEPKSKYGNPARYTVFGKTYKTLDSSKNFTQTGTASWYGTKFHGRRTSSGEVYDMYALTGAHKTLPLPTYAKVTNLDNNKSLIIKINDRGPFHNDRVLDLSYAAAAKLGVLAKGTANIELTAINPKQYLPNLELIQMQIGAFSERHYAQQLANNVETFIKHPVKITSVKDNNNLLYKVHLGPFPSNKLDTIKSKLEKLNIKNPITIATNTKSTNL